MADQYVPKSMGFREGAVFQCLKAARGQLFLVHVVARVYNRTSGDRSFAAAWDEAVNAVKRLAEYGLVEYDEKAEGGFVAGVKPGAVAFEVWEALGELEVGVLTYLRAKDGSAGLNAVVTFVTGCTPSEPKFPSWASRVLDAVIHLRSLGLVQYHAEGCGEKIYVVWLLPQD